MTASADGRTLILALAGIGDLLLASPAVRRLQEGYGIDRCLLAIVPRALDVMPLLEIPGRVLTLPLDEVRLPAPLLRGSARRQVAAFRQRVREAGVTEVVSLHEIGSLRGLLSLSLFLRDMGVRKTIGRGWRGTRLPFRTAVPERALHGLHNVERYHRVADLAGAPGEHLGPRLDTPALPPDLPTLASPLLCLNPGANVPGKRWPIDRLVTVGRTLADRFGGIAVLGGPTEQSESRAIAEAIGTPAVSLAGRVDLSGLAAVLGRASVLVTNNSGPMHLAAALGTPTVALFGNLPVETLHPWLPEGRYRVLTSDRNRLHDSLEAIDVAEVVTAVRTLVEA